jgi:integrase
LLQVLLQKRSNGVWYFRWVCPPRVARIVGKTELIRSLRTRYRLEAHRRAAGYYQTVLRATLALRMNTLTEDQLDTLLRNVWADMEKPLRRPLTYDELDREGSFEEWTGQLYEELLALRDSFDPREDRFSGSYMDWPEILTEAGIDSASYRPEDRERIYQGLLKLRYSFYGERVRQVESFKANQSTPFSSIPLREAPVSLSPLFSVVFRDFLQYKIQAANLSTNMQGDYQRYFDDMIDLMGDLPIAGISKNTIKDFLLLKYRKLPKRILKPYKNKKASELLQMTIPKEHLISDGSVNGIRKFIQSVFAYAVDRGLIAASPATSLKLGLELDETYGVFTKPQMQKVLGWAASEDRGRSYKHREQKRWIVLIAAYTGARLGEIVQLRRVDIKTDAETGRYYIRITVEAGSVKTSAGERSVPIHDRLVEAGFLAMVEQSGERLFPDIEASAITGWFRRFKVEQQLPGKDEDGHPLVFHSFRHTVITLVRAKGVGLDLGLVQQVIGHEKSNEGVTERYTHKHSIADLCRVVDTIAYFG